jgi:hypothetical protein
VKLPKVRLPSVPWRRLVRGPILPWVLTLVFLATTLTNWWLLRNDHREDARADQATTVARQFLRALTTFSADTIDRDVERIRSFAVGDFASQVDDTFSDQRISQIKQAEVVSTSTVRSVAIEDLAQDSATVFGVVDERVTNNVSPAPRDDVLRVELHLIETTTGWKVEQVDILQTPGQTSTLPGG